MLLTVSLWLSRCVSLHRSKYKYSPRKLWHNIEILGLLVGIQNYSEVLMQYLFTLLTRSFYGEDSINHLFYMHPFTQNFNPFVFLRRTTSKIRMWKLKHNLWSKSSESWPPLTSYKNSSVTLLPPWLDFARFLSV